MFNNELYPTPTNVIRQMIKRFDFDYDTTILEPSAGKGDILDYLEEHKRVNKKNMYCLEKESKLSMILSKTGYQYLGDDFLDYSGIISFDYIIMNPPFSNGVDHLLKAWEVIENGEISCLLNASNLLNPNTKDKKFLVELIEQYGEWENIGNVFRDAERKTNVDVALIHLKKVTIKPEHEFDFSGLDTESEFISSDNIEGFQTNAIASNDMIEAIVSQYNMSEQLIKESYTANLKLNTYLNKMFCVDTNDDSLAPVTNIAWSIKELKRYYWKYIFDRVKIAKYLTSGFYKTFNQYIEMQGNVVFNEKNINKLIDMFMLNRGQLVQNSIMEVFYELTRHHFNKRTRGEGWKTNSSYKINKHIIIPYGVEYSYDMFRTRYQINSFLEDLDIIMSYITGISLEKTIGHNICGIVDSLDKEFRELGCDPSMPRPKVDSIFFEIKYFKKGTIHLCFKDTKHRDMLNRTVANNANWVPEKS